MNSKRVPIEPTEAMVEAAYNVLMTSTMINMSSVQVAIREAIAAAPPSDDAELRRLERKLAGWFADDILEDFQMLGLITSNTEWSDIPQYVSGMRTKSLRYLAGIGRIEYHPTDPNLVRVKPTGEKPE